MVEEIFSVPVQDAEELVQEGAEQNFTVEFWASTNGRANS